MNQMDKFRVHNRRQKAKVQLVLWHWWEEKRFLRAACFYQMKIILRKERDQHCRELLVNEIDPAIASHQFRIREIVHQAGRKKRQRIMHLIMFVVAGRLYKCFRKWRELARVHAQYVWENTRRRILNLHRTRLQDAFTKWHHIQTKEKKEKKRKANEHYFTERARMETELQASKLQVDDWEARSLARGKRLLTKAFYQMFLGRVQHRFHQWHAQIALKDFKLAITDQVLVTRRNRRLLRRYFLKYKNQIHKKRRDDNTLPKGEQYEDIIRYRALKRMFNGIKKFTQEYHMAKANLRKRLFVIDQRTKKSFFQLWKREVDVIVNEVRVETQNKKVRRL